MTTPTFTQTTWGEQVARAEAVDALETAGLPFPLDKTEIAYEWSNGRQFRDGNGPYSNG